MPARKKSSGFAEAIAEAYEVHGDALDLGRAVHQGEVFQPRPRKREKEAAGAAGGGADAIGKFLRSRQGKALERQLVRGVFELLRKRL